MVGQDEGGGGWRRGERWAVAGSGWWRHGEAREMTGRGSKWKHDEWWVMTWSICGGRGGVWRAQARAAKRAWWVRAREAAVGGGAASVGRGGGTGVRQWCSDVAGRERGGRQLKMAKS